MVDRLHLGMDERQVKDIMGAPVLTNIIDHTRVTYVYTSQIGSNSRIEKRVTLVFDHNGILRAIQREGV